MNEKKYKNMLESIKGNKTAFALLGFFYKWLPSGVFICYPAMLIAMLITNGFHKSFLLMLCVPAGVLVLVTILRKLINRPRPYEKFSTPPLFTRDGKGESFPSRHTASAFIIAMSGFTINLWLGVILLAISAIIGCARVLSGVHYISDVLAGALLSVLIGTVFFII